MLQDEKEKGSEYLLSKIGLAPTWWSHSFNESLSITHYGRHRRYDIAWDCDQISTSYYIYKNVHSVCDLKNEFVNQKFINTLSEYHKVVIMLGILDIKNGVQAQAVFTNLIQSLRMIKSKIDIAIDVPHIPQISAKGKNYDVDIFNLRLTKLT